MRFLLVSSSVTFFLQGSGWKYGKGRKCEGECATMPLFVFTPTYDRLIKADNKSQIPFVPLVTNSLAHSFLFSSPLGGK